MFLFDGTADIVARQVLVSEYIAQITAACEELVLLEGGRHNAFYLQSGRFRQELLKGPVH